MQEVDNFEDMYCEGCRLRIYERNFDGSNPNEDTSAICEECLDNGMHLRCMNLTQKYTWEIERMWICSTCYEGQSSLENDPDDEGESESDCDSDISPAEMAQLI